MRKVYVIEEYSAKRLEEQINYLLDHDDLDVTNIQYQATSVMSSRDPELLREVNFGGSVYHTALVEYEIISERKTPGGMKIDY